MELLKELLNEYLGHGRDRAGEVDWRQQAVVRQQAMQQQGQQAPAGELWIVTKQGKKYGPFANRDKAMMFFKQRVDIPRDAQLKVLQNQATIH